MLIAPSLFSIYDLQCLASSPDPPWQEFAGSPVIEHFLCAMAGHHRKKFRHALALCNETMCTVPRETRSRCSLSHLVERPGVASPPVTVLFFILRNALRSGASRAKRHKSLAQFSCSAQPVNVIFASPKCRMLKRLAIFMLVGNMVQAVAALSVMLSWPEVMPPF